MSQPASAAEGAAQNDTVPSATGSTETVVENIQVETTEIDTSNTPSSDTAKPEDVPKPIKVEPVEDTITGEIKVEIKSEPAIKPEVKTEVKVEVKEEIGDKTVEAGNKEEDPSAPSMELEIDGDEETEWVPPALPAPESAPPEDEEEEEPQPKPAHMTFLRFRNQVPQRQEVQQKSSNTPSLSPASAVAWLRWASKYQHPTELFHNPRAFSEGEKAAGGGGGGSSGGNLSSNVDVVVPCTPLAIEPPKLAVTNYVPRPKRSPFSEPDLSESEAFNEASLKYRQLPSYHSRQEIVRAIQYNDVVIISGDTGCGKSTQVPQFVMDSGLLAPGQQVICTQPRRVAAITMAEYVAKERGVPLGKEVGYQIRFVNKACESTKLIYATTAIILRRLHSDPELGNIGCLIVDEVHERDVYSEFLLMVCRAMMMNTDPDRRMRLVLMSATLNADSFCDYFQVLCKETTLSPIHIEGRMFPVTEYFLEDAVEWTDFDTARPEGVLPAMKCPCSANGQRCVISKGGKLCKWAGYDPRECLVEIERGRCKDSRCKLMHAVVNQDKCPCISQKGSCPQGDGCRFRGHVSNECLTFLVRGSCRNNDSCKLLHRTIGPSQLDPDKLGQIRGKLKAKYGAPLKFKERTLRSLVFWKAKSIYFELIQELVLLFHKQANSMDASILVFLPGWADISRTMNMLNKASKTLHVLALHSLMSAEQQHLAFEKPPPGKRKVILSTNVAETSVTIDDVVYVIDSGVMKERVYDAERNISSLEVSLITRANAKQRKGRAGRCQQGVVVHLFPSYSLEEMREFPTPEMLSKPLEEVVLQCKVVLQGDMREVLRSSMARPSEDTINNAVGLLQDMNALTRQGKLTALGRAIAALPVHPMVAKMILFAAVFRVLKPAAVIAAFLSCKSPFVHTTGGDDDSGKKQFAGDVFSDHFAAVQAYARWRQVIAKGGDDQAFCEKYDLNYEAMDMAAMMVAQFVQLMRDVGYDGVDCQVAADPTADATLVPLDPNSDAWVLVKAALCAGFYPNVATINGTGGGQPQILNEANDEIQLHRSSVNANRREYKGQWVIHSDSMKLTRVNIMESTIVDTTYPLVFCNTLVDKGESLLIDKWNAKLARPDNKEPLLEAFKLRHDILHGMKAALREHDLSLFPYETAENLVKYLRTQSLPCSSITGTSAKKAVPAPMPFAPTEGAPEGAAAPVEPVVEEPVVEPEVKLPLDQQPEDSIAGWENAPNSEHIFTNVMAAALAVRTEESDKTADGEKPADSAEKPATDGAQPMDVDPAAKPPKEGETGDTPMEESAPEGESVPATPKTPAPKPTPAPAPATPAAPVSKALHGNYKYPVADEPETDTVLPPMDLGYEETSDAINDMRFGSPCTPEFLLRWIHAGAASSEFVALCSYCTQELLGCPIAAPVYENLGIILRRLDCSIHPQGLYHDVESRKMALEFLVSEVLAMRVVETRIIEGKLDILNKVKAAPRATEREAAGACVSTLAESLGMDTSLDPIGLVREASPLIQDTILKEVHPTYTQPVLKESDYNEDELNKLATICAALREDYTYRRATMLTRLKVTIQSFEWTQKKDVDRNLITATRDAVMGACLEQPSVMPQHIFCIPAAVLVFWADKIKPSKATKVEARHKLVTIGNVPDRGGRTNTYNFEFRVETDVTKANAELKAKYNSGPAQQAQKGGAKPAAPPGRTPAAAPAPAAAAPTPAPSKGKERASSPVSKDRKKSRSPRRSPARKSPKRDKRRSRSPKRRSRSPKRGRSSDRKRERSSERHRSSDKYGTSSAAPYGYSAAGYDAATLAQYYYAAGGYPSNYQYDNRR